MCVEIMAIKNQTALSDWQNEIRFPRVLLRADGNFRIEVEVQWRSRPVSRWIKKELEHHLPEWEIGAEFVKRVENGDCAVRLEFAVFDRAHARGMTVFIEFPLPRQVAGLVIQRKS